METNVDMLFDVRVLSMSMRVTASSCSQFQPKANLTPASTAPALCPEHAIPHWGI